MAKQCSQESALWAAAAPPAGQPLDLVSYYLSRAKRRLLPIARHRTTAEIEALLRCLAGKGLLCRYPRPDAEDEFLRDLVRRNRWRDCWGVAPRPMERPPRRTARTIRVSLFTPALTLGGAERWMMDFVDSTSPSVHVVGVAVLSPHWVEPKGVLEMSRRAPVHGYDSSAARRLLRESDVVIAWGLTQLPEIVAGYRGKVVVVAHGSDVAWTRLMVQSGKPAATHFVAVSEAALRPFEGVVDLAKVTVIPNGLRTDRLQPSVPREVARARLGIQHDEFVAGYVGRYSAEKRAELLIETVARLGPPFRGLFCGAGDKEAELRARAKGLTGRILFAGHRFDLGDILSAMDVFCGMSSDEGFFYTACEAAVARVPLMITRVGIFETIAKRHGILWEEIGKNPSPQAMARVVRGIRHAPPDRMAARTERLREALLSECSLEKMGARWEEFLARIVPGDRR